MAQTILIYGSASELAAAAAGRIVSVVNGALGERPVCSVMLSGGLTPRSVYERLAAARDRDALRWDSLQFFFGDERAVPPTHADSNFRMADEELFSKVPVSPQQIHRIRAETEPSSAASEYGSELRTILGGDWSNIDLLLLGLGTDGHIASLFPDSPALDEQIEPVVAVSEAHVRWSRITVTLPVINAARNVIVLASGDHKAEIVHKVLTTTHPVKEVPATMVRPMAGTLLWMVDAAAASRLGEEGSTVSEERSGE
jgi:6-phosphogluconolactonase